MEAVTGRLSSSGVQDRNGLAGEDSSAPYAKAGGGGGL